MFEEIEQRRFTGAVATDDDVDWFDLVEPLWGVREAFEVAEFERYF